jgi:hypothetical protein
MPRTARTKVAHLVVAQLACVLELADAGVCRRLLLLGDCELLAQIALERSAAELAHAPCHPASTRGSVTLLQLLLERRKLGA